jgi:hypothetical protein
VDPLAYLLWNPNFLDAFPDLQPLRDLQERIAYREQPDPTEEIVVKRRRVVQLSTVADRIIQRALARRLNQNFDRHLAPSSWGYRPRRSSERAIVEVRDHIRRGAHWAFKTDIKDFFGNVDRDILRAKLDAWVADKELCDFVMATISPVVLTKRGSFYKNTGLPQGNGITPFLSNLYLHELDLACSCLRYFRYADDILVLGDTPQEVLQAERLIRNVLSRLHLTVKDQKTYVRDLYQQPITYLGYEIRGGKLYPTADAISQFQRKLRFRGLEERKNLMVSFVHRFRKGPVRKLFRRLDRNLIRLYPPGFTLVGLLEVSAVSALPVPQAARHDDSVYCNYGH